MSTIAFVWCPPEQRQTKADLLSPPRIPSLRRRSAILSPSSDAQRELRSPRFNRVTSETSRHGSNQRHRFRRSLPGLWGPG